jgi:hypothetical protein
MRMPYELKIDAYAHIVPPKYREALAKAAPELHDGYYPIHPLTWTPGSASWISTALRGGSHLGRFL